ncbi:MAG: hypothetical protein Q3983_09980 [Capnocytophaga sp.]|nr:hypothetical protein [Capnocytophaga sp.]
MEKEIFLKKLKELKHCLLIAKINIQEFSLKTEILAQQSYSKLLEDNEVKIISNEIETIGAEIEKIIYHIKN